MMKDRNPHPTASHQCEASRAAVANPTEAGKTRDVNLPVQPQTHDMPSKQKGSCHPHLHQAQEALLKGAYVAARLQDEDTGEAPSEGSAIFADVRDSKSSENVHGSSPAVSHGTGSSPCAARPSCAAAGSLSSSFLGSCVEVPSPLASAFAQSEPRFEKSPPGLPYAHSSPPSQRETCRASEKLLPTAFGGLNLSSEAGLADAQGVPLSALILPVVGIAAAASAEPALCHRTETVAGLGGALAANTTVEGPLFKSKRGFISVEKKHLEEGEQAGAGKLGADATVCRPLSCTLSPSQHPGRTTSDSSSSWHAPLGVAPVRVHRPGARAEYGRRERQHQGALPHKQAGHAGAAAQPHQPQEDVRPAAGSLAGRHGVGVVETHERKLERDHGTGKEGVEASHLVQEGGVLQVGSFLVAESLCDGVVLGLTREALLTGAPSPAKKPPPSSAFRAEEEPFAGSASQGFFAAENLNPTTETRVNDKEADGKNRKDIFSLNVDGAAAASSAVGCCESNEVRGRGAAVAEVLPREQGIASPLDTPSTREEESRTQRGAAASPKRAAPEKSREEEAATEKRDPFGTPSSPVTAARSTSSSLGEESSDDSEAALFCDSSSSERIVAEETGSGIDTLFLERSSGCSRRIASLLRFSSHRLPGPRTVEQQLDTACGGESAPEKNSGGPGGGRGGRSSSSCCEADDVSPVAAAAGAGSAARRGSAVLHGEQRSGTRDGPSNGFERKNTPNGTDDERLRRYPGEIACSNYWEDGRGNRFRWMRAALHKLALLFLRWPGTVRRRMRGREARSGKVLGDVATSRVGGDTRARPRQDHGDTTPGKRRSPQLDAEGQAATVEEPRELGDPTAKRGERCGTRTTQERRALFECCMSSARGPPTTPLGLSRYVLLSVYTLQAFLTGCLYFGWPALSSMLYRSGAYAWLCSSSEGGGGATSASRAPAETGVFGAPPAASAASRLYLCNAQDAAVAPLFSVCHVSDCVMCVIAGYLTDRCSPKGVCIFGQILHAVGWTLLACSSERFPAYLPAMISIGCGCATAYLPLLRVALLFPRRKATIIAILGAANTGSFAVPCILDAIWRQAGVRTNAAATVAAAAAGSRTHPVLSPEGSSLVGTRTPGVLPDGTSGPPRSPSGGKDLAGGSGWTFTDVCLLYLGVGPLFCMLLAAFFLPSQSFSLLLAERRNNAWKPEDAQSDTDVADQEAGKPWRRPWATTGASDSGEKATPTRSAGMTSGSGATTTGTEKENNSDAGPSPAGTMMCKLLCQYFFGCKRHSGHVQRQQKQKQSGHPRSPRVHIISCSRHVELDDECDDHWPLERFLREEGQHATGGRTHQQPQAAEETVTPAPQHHGGAEEKAAEQQRAVEEEASYDIINGWVPGPEQPGGSLRLQSRRRHRETRDAAGAGGRVGGGAQKNVRENEEQDRSSAHRLRSKTKQLCDIFRGVRIERRRLFRAEGEQKEHTASSRAAPSAATTKEEDKEEDAAAGAALGEEERVLPGRRFFLVGGDRRRSDDAGKDTRRRSPKREGHNSLAKASGATTTAFAARSQIPAKKCTRVLLNWSCEEHNNFTASSASADNTGPTTTRMEDPTAGEEHLSGFFPPVIFASHEQLRGADLLHPSGCTGPEKVTLATPPRPGRISGETLGEPAWWPNRGPLLLEKAEDHPLHGKGEAEGKPAAVFGDAVVVEADARREERGEGREACCCKVVTPSALGRGRKKPVSPGKGAKKPSLITKVGAEEEMRAKGDAGVLLRQSFTPLFVCPSLVLRDKQFSPASRRERGRSEDAGEATTAREEQVRQGPGEPSREGDMRDRCMIIDGPAEHVSSPREEAHAGGGRSHCLALRRSKEKTSDFHGLLLLEPLPSLDPAAPPRTPPSTAACAASTPQIAPSSADGTCFVQAPASSDKPFSTALPGVQKMQENSGHARAGQEIPRSPKQQGRIAAAAVSDNTASAVPQEEATAVGMSGNNAASADETPPNNARAAGATAPATHYSHTGGGAAASPPAVVLDLSEVCEAGEKKSSSCGAWHSLLAHASIMPEATTSTSSTIATGEACCLPASTADPASDQQSLGSLLPCIDSCCKKKKATLSSQCLSVHFACLVFYSGIVSVAMSFMQSSSSRLFSETVMAFMDWALPFSFIPCVILGRLIDVFGPFPVLVFMNSMGLISYLCAASTSLESVHYVSVLAFCAYVSLDSEQIYCYVEYTFRPEHFGRLSGLLMAIDGAMSLVSLPLYDHLTVRSLGGNPLPVAFGISGLLGVAYLILGGLWVHRRKDPDPFGLLDQHTLTEARPAYGRKDKATPTGEEEPNNKGCPVAK